MVFLNWFSKFLYSPLEYRYNFVKRNLESFLTLRRKNMTGPHEGTFREWPYILVQITGGVICESVPKGQGWITDMDATCISTGNWQQNPRRSQSPWENLGKRDLDELALLYTWSNRSEVMNIKLKLLLVEIKNAEVSFSLVLIFNSLRYSDISGLWGSQFVGVK